MRQRHCQALTPGGRALWGWPVPGEPFDPAAPLPAEYSEIVPLPEPFLLLHIVLAQVELLELTGHPHRRWSLVAGNRLAGEPLHP